MREAGALRVWVHMRRSGVHPHTYMYTNTHIHSMFAASIQTAKARLTFPKLPFPSTRMNSKLSMPNLLEELTPIPFPSLEPSFPCRLSVDLEMSFCKEEECRHHTVSSRWVWTPGEPSLVVSHLSLHPACGDAQLLQLKTTSPSASGLYVLLCGE